VPNHDRGQQDCGVSAYPACVTLAALNERRGP
jgi:hypothetical protein